MAELLAQLGPLAEGHVADSEHSGAIIACTAHPDDVCEFRRILRERDGVRINVLVTGLPADAAEIPARAAGTAKRTRDGDIYTTRLIRLPGGLQSQSRIFARARNADWAPDRKSARLRRGTRSA